MESWIIGMSHTSGKSKNDDTEGSGPRPPVPGEECCVEVSFFICLLDIYFSMLSSVFCLRVVLPVLFLHNF